MKTPHTLLILLLICIFGNHAVAQNLELESAPKETPAQPAPPATAPTPPDIGLINPVAIGIRLSPDGGGITGKIFLDRDWVIEALVSGSQGYDVPGNNTTSGGSWSATVLGEYHIIFQDPSWRIYFGAGLHTGKWDKYNYADEESAPRPEGIFGADAIVGGEYLFKSVPIGISLDAKPAVNFISDPGFFPNDIFGLSVRYYMGRKVVLRVENPE